MQYTLSHRHRKFKGPRVGVPGSRGLGNSAKWRKQCIVCSTDMVAPYCPILPHTACPGVGAVDLGVLSKWVLIQRMHPIMRKQLCLEAWVNRGRPKQRERGVREEKAFHSHGGMPLGITGLPTCHGNNTLLRTTQGGQLGSTNSGLH